MQLSKQQIEKNLSTSFAYVKKDILMLNDSYTNMQKAINQMAESYKVLADEIKQQRKDIDKFSVKKKDKKVAKKKDKLNLIEGIGPVIEKLLNKNKITTFKQLSNKKASEIKDILDKEGPKFQMHDPTTWAKQAKLASEEKWSELDKLQDTLKGGVKISNTKKTPKKAVKRIIKETTVYE